MIVSNTKMELRPMSAGDDVEVGGWERKLVLSDGWRNLPPRVEAAGLGEQMRMGSAGSWILRLEHSPVACVTLYEYRPDARRAWLSVVTKPGRTGVIGLMAAAMMLEGVFELGLLDRMWIEVPDHRDSRRVRALGRFGFELHGSLAECAYGQGTWRSRSVLSCTSERWTLDGSPSLHARWGRSEVVA